MIQPYPTNKGEKDRQILTDIWMPFPHKFKQRKNDSTDRIETPIKEVSMSPSGHTMKLYLNVDRASAARNKNRDSRCSM